MYSLLDGQLLASGWVISGLQMLLEKFGTVLEINKCVDKAVYYQKFRVFGGIPL
jgi:hypothetical protein